MSDTITSTEAARILKMTQEGVNQRIRVWKISAVKVPFPSRYGYRWLIDPASITPTNGHRTMRQRLADMERELSNIKRPIG